MKKNKNYSNEYKFKVALEMIRGDLTVAEIISKYQVPRSVLHRWKNQLLENGADIFSSSKASNLSSSDNAEIDKLWQYKFMQFTRKPNKNRNKRKGGSTWSDNKSIFLHGSGARPRILGSRTPACLHRRHFCSIRTKQHSPKCSWAVFVQRVHQNDFKDLHPSVQTGVQQTHGV